jgi:hypothetical protein
MTPGSSAEFHKMFVGYLDALPENKRLNLLYSEIMNTSNEQLALKLSDILKELNLLELTLASGLLHNTNFEVQKRGLRVITYDKPFFNKEDKLELETIIDYVRNTFTERGIRATKKQLLSSKDKEVWNCECGKTNDIGSLCSGCHKRYLRF